MPSSLAEIVALAETNGEMLLAARIRNHVKLVSLKPGNLQIGLVGAAPDQLAGDIARCTPTRAIEHGESIDGVIAET